MNQRDKRILRDLTDHLREKVSQNVEDYVSLCRSADLEPNDVMDELMTFFIHLVTSFAANQFNISARDFATTIIRQFNLAQNRVDQEDCK